MKCGYCGTQNQDDIENCPKCGAPNERRSFLEPFYFHGFMIWPEKDWSKNCITFHIWLGTQRIGYFDISCDMELEFINIYGEGISAEPLYEKLLRLAVGQSEVEKFEQINNGRRYLFEIKRTEAPEYQNIRNTIFELMDDHERA